MNNTSVKPVARSMFVVFVAGNEAISVLPKAKYSIDSEVVAELSEAQRAHSLRMNWMRRMGFDEVEIEEELQCDPPHSVEEEMEQIRALDNLDRNTPSFDAWQKVAVKY
jgi:hypothetical protein